MQKFVYLGNILVKIAHNSEHFEQLKPLLSCFFVSKALTLRHHHKILFYYGLNTEFCSRSH